tara:strand:+ start:348 stop:689 length:342 start_codon:yes stop_codon:yes gene_type:complete
MVVRQAARLDKAVALVAVEVFQPMLMQTLVVQVVAVEVDAFFQEQEEQEVQTGLYLATLALVGQEEMQTLQVAITATQVAVVVGVLQVVLQQELKYTTHTLRLLYKAVQEVKR